MSLLRLLGIALVLAFAGCANVKTVRDFARESARFPAYRNLTERFRDTYPRERAYVTGAAAMLALENDRKRRAVCRDLLELDRILTRYLQTLAVLAGDRTFRVPEALDTLGSGLAAHPELGLEATHLEAGLNLAQVAARWLALAHQAGAVRAMLREGDPALQTLLQGMLAIVDHYRKTYENESRAVLGLLEVELAYAHQPQDRLLAALGQAHLQAKAREYTLADRDYPEAERGLRAIQEGHRQLQERLDRLSSKEARARIGSIIQDLRVLRENLQAAQAW